MLCHVCKCVINVIVEEYWFVKNVYESHGTGRGDEDGWGWGWGGVNRNGKSLTVIISFTVATLIYWRDPKTTGAVFGAILGLLLSLAYFSLISVLAYLSLLILIGTVAFRIYKSVLQAIQKTSDGHPFK